MVRRPAVRLAAAAVLVLLPGATSTSATIEFVSGDMVSGASRLAFGIMLYPCTPLAFWLDTLFVIGIAFSARLVAQLVVSAAPAAGVVAALAYGTALWINSRKGSGPLSLVLFVPAYWLLVPGSASFVAVAGAVVSDTNLRDVDVDAARNAPRVSVSAPPSKRC